MPPTKSTAATSSGRAGRSDELPAARRQLSEPLERDLITALGVLRRAGLAPTVLAVTPNSAHEDFEARTADHR